MGRNKGAGVVVAPPNSKPGRGMAVLRRGLLALAVAMVPTAGWNKTLDTGSQARGDLRVLAKPQEAVQRAFDKEAEIRVCVLTLDKEARSSLEKELKRKLSEEDFRIHVGSGPEGEIRYAVLTDEIGKHRPFTFLVVIEKDLSIAYLELLIYRESHGSQIRRKRFLDQYKRKGPQDRIRSGKEIVNIAGATLSVRGVSRGVQKVLKILEYARKHGLCPFWDEDAKEPS